jgi:hypothetical protein
MTTRIVVTLNQEERESLAILAELELRSLRDQIRTILRKYIRSQEDLLGGIPQSEENAVKLNNGRVSK